MARKATPLRIIPLGGLDGIGKNMTAFEYGDDLVLIDAGLMFPDDEQPGIDLVLPDYTYVLENEEKLRGIIKRFYIGTPNELQILNGISQRNAQWYYLAAVANYGAGNTILGLDYAKRAAEMEPDNPRYADLVQRMENAGTFYRQTGEVRYGMPKLRVNKLCLGMILTNVLCNILSCLGGGGGMYCPFFCC